MCGITAVAAFGTGQGHRPTRDLIERMADLVAHRGPDGRAVLVDGRVGLGFTRLSLVDPSPSGDQPLVSDDDSLVLVANGEVYNSRELIAGLPADSRPRGGSDCEVLLYLYRAHGLDFLDHVRGMFGLILWDRARDQLVVARDRFGIKPLYYHRDADRIVLGSEIKSLFADAATPRQLDWEAALSSPMLPATPELVDMPLSTWFVGIEAVPAGTVLRIDLRTGATEQHRYWTFPGAAEPLGSSHAYVDAYRDLLIESIGECATADTELGVFLSGGIDSAAVAAVAADRIGKLHTFTVLDAGTYAGGDVEYAHRLSVKLGLPNHQVVFDPARVPDPTEWKRVLWLMEDPMCGPEAYYKYELHRYARSVRPDLRGMLLGAASDEFNGGYSNGTLTTDGGDWSDFQANLAGMVRSGALRDRPALTPWWTYGERPLLTDDVIQQFTGRHLGDPYRDYLRWEYAKIQQYNVWHEDRAAAGSGIEARVPFLDHRLVELVTSIPPDLRPELLWDKAILRAAMRGLLPEETVRRPKMPFFYGPGLHYTYGTFLRMLSVDDASLVEEALAAPGADLFLSGQAIRETVRALQDQTGSPQVEIVLRVVNLGLLSAMAADLPAPLAATDGGPVRERLPVTDWVAQHEDIEQRIGMITRIDPNSIPVLRDDVLLLHDARRPGVSYLAVDGSLEYELDGSEPELSRLLAAVDGERTLAALLADVDADIETVQDAVIDLLTQNLVKFR